MVTFFRALFTHENRRPGSTRQGVCLRRVGASPPLEKGRTFLTFVKTALACACLLCEAIYRSPRARCHACLLRHLRPRPASCVPISRGSLMSQGVCLFGSHSCINCLYSACALHW